MASRAAFARVAASSRAASEDRADVVQCGDDLILVVADGAGGIAGGATAAEAVVDALRSRAAKRLDAFDFLAWSDLLQNIDVDLARRLAGETTAIAVCVGARGVMGVSAGDSEAWIVNSQSVDRLTESQSRWRIGSGRATPVPFHRPGLDGTLIVATDGLFKHATAESIVAACMLDSAASVAAALVALPKLPSGDYPDDVAAIVVR